MDFSIVPNVGNASISDTSEKARQLLRCCQSIRDDETKTVAAAQTSRFNLWASNIGVFSAHHASLDYRLRTAPAVKAAISGNIEMLCKALLSVLMSKIDPTEDDLDTFADLSAHEVYDFGLLLLQSSNSTEGRMNGLGKVETTIDTLHQLSLAIRSTSDRYSLAKIPRLFDIDKEFVFLREMGIPASKVEDSVGSTRFEITSNFEDFLSRVLRTRWLTRDTNAELDVSQSSYRELLLRRCVVAISMRRRQLTYFRSHQAKLVVQPPTQTVQPDVRTLNQQSTPIKVDGSQLRDNPPLESMSSLMPRRVFNPLFSETAPSRMAPATSQVLRHPPAPSSITSSNDARGLRTGGVFEVPSAPDLVLGEKEKMCPYCCLVLPAKTYSMEKKSRRWKKHLLDDLRPYVCLHRNCSQPGENYRTFKDWQSHLDEHHDEDWLCPLPHEEDDFTSEYTQLFDTFSAFEEHLSVHHRGLNAFDTRNAIRTAGQPAVHAKWCFVCLTEQNDTIAYQRHVANHLELAFLLALPGIDDIRESDTTSSGQNSSQARASDGSLLQSVDFSDVGSLYNVDSGTSTAKEIRISSQKAFADQLSSINAQSASVYSSLSMAEHWTSQVPIGQEPSDPESYEKLGSWRVLVWVLIFGIRLRRKYHYDRHSREHVSEQQNHEALHRRKEHERESLTRDTADQERSSLVEQHAAEVNTIADEIKETQSCLKALKTSDYERHKNFHPDAARGTCFWIFDFVEYQNFMSSTENSLLWITADPGCGKSVLTKFLVDNNFGDVPAYTKTNSIVGPHSICYYFFNKEGNDLATALCAILHQLFVQQPRLSRYAVPEHRMLGKSLGRQVDALWKILKAVLGDSEVQYTVLVLDGLDECCDREQLVDLLLGSSDNLSPTSHERGRVRWLITCRLWPYLQNSSGLFSPSRFHINLNDEREKAFLQTDINLIITNRLDELTKEYSLSRQQADQMRGKLLSMRNEPHLLLYHIFIDVQKALHNSLTPSELTLETLPESLSDVYETFMDEVHRNSKGKISLATILMIMVGAEESLTTWEMAAAYSLANSTSPINSLDILQAKVQENGLQKWTEKLLFGIVVIKYDRYYFNHRAAEESVRYQLSKHFPGEGSWRHNRPRNPVQHVMAKICMSYLCLDDFNEPHRRRSFPSNRTYSFFEFAATNWAGYVRGIEDTLDGLLQENMQLLYDDSSRRFSLIKESITQGPNDQHMVSASGVYMAAANGHVVYLQRLLKSTPDRLNFLDDSGYTALTRAIFHDQLPVMQILLDNGANVNARHSDGRTPLQVASDLKSEEIIRVLLKFGAVAKAQTYGNEVASSTNPHQGKQRAVQASGAPETIQTDKNSQADGTQRESPVPYMSVPDLLDWYHKKKEVPDTGLMEDLKGHSIVFVIDDSSSMKLHWPQVVRLFAILAEFTKDCNDDGVELFFTRSRHDRMRQKHSRTLIQRVQALEGSLDGPSEPSTVFRKIFDKERCKILRDGTRKYGIGSAVEVPLVVCFLTDGVWQPNTNLWPEIFRVVDLLEQPPAKPFGHVDIQFIQFGHDLRLTEKLKAYEDLPSPSRVIVDVERCDGNTWKMLLGSLDASFD